jgi:4-amino-4-deoxy-L-arabinose transferase-like glycosyltransferase
MNIQGRNVHNIFCNKNKKWLHFIIAFIAIGGGMLTKGPIALFVPIFAFGSHFLLHRNFKQIFKWQYIIGIIIIALVLLPMSIGLYQQFDLHPEKLINGKQCVSGLKFFFWTQSFGRITGESDWDNNSGFLFLLQNMLWTFLPWMFIFLAGFFSTLVRLFKNKLSVTANEEFITYGGFLLTYCSLAFSRYQLPHYIFVVFPFAAIITGRFIYNLCWANAREKVYKIFFYSHAFIFFILLVLANVLISFCYPESSMFLKIFIVLATITYLFILFIKSTILPKLFFICVYTILIINLALNAGFYPALLKYQSGNVVGNWVRKNNIPKDNFITFQNNDVGHSLHFYANRIVPAISDVRQLTNGKYLFTREEGKAYLDSLSINYKTVLTGGDYGVSMLRLKFLNPATRNLMLNRYYILQVADNPIITDTLKAQ